MNHRIQNVLLCGYVFILALMCVKCANAQIYYVDNTITDTNVGSYTPDLTAYNHTTFATTGGTDKAFKTIADINSLSDNAHLSPGDSVLFRRGQEWREVTLQPWISGTNGNQITYGAFGSGAKPLLSSANLYNSGWSNYATNVWRVSLTTAPYVVYINGNFGTVKSSAGEITSQYQWFWGANYLYIYATSDPATLYTTPGVEASVRGTVFHIQSTNYITVDNLDIRQSNAAGGDGNGIYLHGTTSYAIISNCNIQGNYDRGINFYNGTNNTLQYNTITNNTIIENGSEGISTLSSDNYSTISYNTIANNGKNGGIASGITGQLDNGSIHHNTFYGNGNIRSPFDGFNHGIYVTAGTTVGPIIEYNTSYSHTNGEGFQARGSALFRYNISYNNAQYGFALGDVTAGATINSYYNIAYSNQSCLRILPNTYTSTFNTYNNTCYVNGVDQASTNYPSELGISGTAGTNVLNVKNNIAYTKAGVCDGHGSGSCGFFTGMALSGTYFHSDYNIFYMGSSLMLYNSSSNNPVNFDTWKGYGWDANSINSNPLLNNPTTDFTIAYNSPAIDAGVDVGLTQDYAGNIIYGIPDIGAYEYQPPYTQLSDRTNISGGSRIYSNGKFRTVATSGTPTAALFVSPTSKSFSTCTTSAVCQQWMDIGAGFTWETKTAKQKKHWVESSTSLGSTTIYHSIGDLSANTFYDVTIDNQRFVASTIKGVEGTYCSRTYCKSNGQGKINFTFTGNYGSSHTFDIVKNTTHKPALLTNQY